MVCSQVGFLQNLLIVNLVQYDTLAALLFKDRFGNVTVHKATGTLYAIAEIIQQVAQTAGKTPLNIFGRDVIFYPFVIV